ncbi:MAG: hypothetical protein LBD92_04460, partial [Oscillospiraceae bacterium]|nr:hypothetical protein [Oscillospiraceae bacterium]
MKILSTKKMTRLNGKPAKKLFAGVLAFAMVFAIGAQPVLATPEDEIKKHSGGNNSSAEYYAFTKMWSEYFLEFLPTSAEPEALQLLTNIPDYDGKNGWNSGRYPETGAWGGYFTGG